MSAAAAATSLKSTPPKPAESSPKTKRKADGPTDAFVKRVKVLETDLDAATKRVSELGKQLDSSKQALSIHELCDRLTSKPGTELLVFKSWIDAEEDSGSEEVKLAIQRLCALNPSKRTANVLVHVTSNVFHHREIDEGDWEPEIQQLIIDGKSVDHSAGCKILDCTVDGDAKVIGPASDDEYMIAFNQSNWERSVECDSTGYRKRKGTGEKYSLCDPEIWEGDHDGLGAELYVPIECVWIKVKA